MNSHSGWVEILFYFLLCFVVWKSRKNSDHYLLLAKKIFFTYKSNKPKTPHTVRYLLFIFDWHRILKYIDTHIHACICTHILLYNRRRQWHPTPVLLPGKSPGWRSLVGCSPWGPFHFSLSHIGEGNGNSSVLAWRIPGTGEPGGLPSMGSHRVGHDWSDLAAAALLYNTDNWQEFYVLCVGYFAVF